VTAVAGLYKVAVGVFTHADATVQFLVAGEAVLTLEPPRQPSGGSDATYNAAHALRRSAHSAGDCACICIDEYVALPAPAELSVRFDLGLDVRDAACQAFLSIEKV